MKWLGKHTIFDDLMIGGVLLTPPDPATYSYELTLPNDDGASGQVLTTDGSGVLTWTTPTGGTGVSMTNGVDNRVMTATAAQAITGEANLTFDGAKLDVAGGGTSTWIVGATSSTLNTGYGFYADLNDSLTASHNNIGLYIDYDKSGVTATGQTATLQGVKVDINDAATNHGSGTVLLKGLNACLTSANATGTIKQYGVFTELTGADEQYGIKQTLTGATVGTTYGLWNRIADGGYDLMFKSFDVTTDDYFSLATGVSGATAITTVDGGGAAANLSFTIDGQFSVASTGIDISGAGVITNAEWQGTDVGVAYGGTGLSTVGTNEVLTGNGTGALTSESDFTFGATAYQLLAGMNGSRISFGSIYGSGFPSPLTSGVGSNIVIDGYSLFGTPVASAIKFKSSGAWDQADAYIEAHDATGTDKSGGDLILVGGASTGSDIGGSLKFYGGASGGGSATTVRVPTQKFEIDGDGNTTMSGDLTVTGGDITIGTTAGEKVSTGQHIHKQTKVTFDQAACNAINGGTVASRTLVAAQGANQIIVPVSVTVLVDRNSADTSAADLIVGYNGTTSYHICFKVFKKIHVWYTNRYAFFNDSLCR